MARLADIQAARLAGALLTGDAVKRDAPFTLICRRKVRFWIGASATLAAIILVSWKVESHDSQSSGLSLGALSPIQEKDMKFTQAMSVAVAAGSICSGVMAQSTAVQWTVASGGNGHWYALYQQSSALTRDSAKDIANSNGGHLVSITSEAEWNFVKNLSSTDSAWANYWVGPIIGMHVDGDTCNAGCWDTNESVDFVAWHPGNPDLPTTDQCVIMFKRDAMGWQNYPCDSTNLWGTTTKTAIIEYSADCNNDGIVDYGQILSGQLIDTNSNGIPDICEIDPCPGDINLNSIVDAVDLAMVLTSWGTSGSEYPRADVNHDGVVNGPDLGALLGGWGLCP